MVMKKRAFNINVPGRVKKVKTKNFLVPLFEAISNSIHSIDDSNKEGSIEVEIIRAPRQRELFGDESPKEVPITGFRITDSGTGFVESNMDSFCEADSTQKATRGGKGVGRFSWLKFFEKAEIESVFCDNDGGYKRRVFVFSKEGIAEAFPVPVSASISTSVTLSPLRLEFEPKTRRSLDEVIAAVIEHFITYLVTNSLPTLTIIDGAARINVAEYFQKTIGRNAIKNNFIVNGVQFKTVGIRVYGGNHSHTALLCADKRVAERVLLGKQDSFFAKKFVDDDLQGFAYHIYLEAPYLDSIVNEDRDGLRFPEDELDEFLDDPVITKEQLLVEVINVAHRDMGDLLEKIKEQNKIKVADFVSRTAPQYRYIVSKYPDKIASIHDNEPLKIDLALRRLQFEEELRTKVEI